MTFDDLQEALDVLTVATTALKAAVPGQTGRDGAELHYACGDLLAQAKPLIASGELFAAERGCFDQAVTAGATLAGLLTLRRAMVATAPNGVAGRYIVGITCALAVSAEGKVLSQTQFASSNSALSALGVFSSAVDIVQQWAADNGQPALYQSLIALGAAVSRDLTSRAAPLPRITTYTFPRGTTSHVLAYRLYGDANRADELRDENQVIAPAFMPASGSALSD